MFDWLQGPGRGLRHPLKGSTNYLSAYDSRGQLTRLRDKDEDKDPNTPTSRRQEGSDAEVGPIREREGTRSLHENGGKEEDALPPERSRDLRPYPLNSHFKSQPVLSEDLREEIWRRVQEAGVNIKVVSAELGVSIERVGAVVRMKEVEKRWLAEVSVQVIWSFLHSTTAMMIKIPKSISLEDYNHGYKNCFASLSDLAHFSSN